MFKCESKCWKSGNYGKQKYRIVRNNETNTVEEQVFDSRFSGGIKSKSKGSYGANTAGIILKILNNDRTL